MPDLVLYEIANALRYNDEFSEKDVTEAMNSLIEMDIVITIPSKELLDKSIRIARGKGITVYDSIYIALSEIINAKFITADERLKGIENVKMLSDFVQKNLNLFKGAN